MTLQENSLYSTDKEKEELLNNPNEIMDNLYINYFGTIGLFKLDSSISSLKKYFKKDGKLQVRNITDDNNDNSLIIKLALEKDLIRSNTANKMTKLLALLKQGQLDGKDIDPVQIKELVKEIPSSSRANPRINTTVNSLINDEIGLDQFTKSVYKEAVKKGYSWKNSEFAKLVHYGKFTQIFKNIDNSALETKQKTETSSITPTQTVTGKKRKNLDIAREIMQSMAGKSRKEILKVMTDAGISPVTASVYHQKLKNEYSTVTPTVSQPVQSVPTVPDVQPVQSVQPVVKKRKNLDIAREIMQSMVGKSRKEILKVMTDAGISPVTASVYHQKLKNEYSTVTPVVSQPVVNKIPDNEKELTQPEITTNVPKFDTNKWVSEIIKLGSSEQEINNKFSELKDDNGLRLLSDELKNIIKNLDTTDFLYNIEKYRFQLKLVKNIPNSVLNDIPSLLSEKVVDSIINETDPYNLCDFRINNFVRMCLRNELYENSDEIKTPLLEGFIANKTNIKSNVYNLLFSLINGVDKDINKLNRVKSTIETIIGNFVETFTRSYALNDIITLEGIINTIPKDNRTIINTKFLNILYCGDYFNNPISHIKNIEKFVDLKTFFIDLEYDVTSPENVKIFESDNVTSNIKDSISYYSKMLQNFKGKVEFVADTTDKNYTQKLLLLIEAIQYPKKLSQKDFDNLVKDFSQPDSIDRIDWSFFENYKDISIMNRLYVRTAFPKPIMSVYIKLIEVVNKDIENLFDVYNSLMLEFKITKPQLVMMVENIYRKLDTSSNIKTVGYLGAFVFRFIERFIDVEDFDFNSNIDLLKKFITIAERSNLDSITASLLMTPEFYPLFSDSWKMKFLQQQFKNFDLLGSKEENEKLIESKPYFSYSLLFQRISPDFYHLFYLENFNGFFKSFIEDLRNFESDDYSLKFQIRSIGANIAKNFDNIDENELSNKLQDLSINYRAQYSGYENDSKIINSLVKGDIEFFKRVIDNLPLEKESDISIFIDILKDGRDFDYIQLNFEQMDAVFTKIINSKNSKQNIENLLSSTVLSDSFANTKLLSILTEHISSISEESYKTMKAEDVLKLVEYGKFAKKGNRSVKGEFNDSIADMSYMLYKNNNKECDKLLSLLPRTDSKKILERLGTNLTIKRIFESDILYNSDIKPLKRLTDVEMLDLLKFNTLLPEPPKLKGVKSIGDLESAVNSADLSYLEKMNITKINGDKEYFERQTVEFYKMTNRHHGNVALEFLEEFDVVIPNNQELHNQFIAEHPNTEIVYPMFHGTGSNAASMILRAGFKDVDPTTLKSIKVTGKGLGPGIYFTNVLNKSAQYVGDKGYGRRLGDEGYIFSLKAALGEWFKNYETGGNVSGKKERPNARKWDSPEWVVREGNKQCLVLKAYKVVKTSRDVVRKLREKYKLNEDTNIMEVKTFKEFMVESTYEKYKFATTFTFKDGMVPVKESEVVESEDFKAEKYGDHVKMNYSQFGPMIVIYHNEESFQGSYVMNYASSFTTTDIGKKYLKLLNKK